MTGKHDIHELVGASIDEAQYSEFIQGLEKISDSGLALLVIDIHNSGKYFDKFVEDQMNLLYGAIEGILDQSAFQQDAHCSVDCVKQYRNTKTRIQTPLEESIFLYAAPKNLAQQLSDSLRSVLESLNIPRHPETSAAVIYDTENNLNYSKVKVTIKIKPLSTEAKELLH